MIIPNGTLVILTPGFASSENDSTCLPMQQSLIRTFADIYPELKIIVLSFQYPYQDTKYNWFNATVYTFNGKNRGGIRKLLLRRKIYKTLEQIRISHNIIGFLSFWYGECAVVAKKFGGKYGIPHYCWLLGQDARHGNKHPYRNPLNATELIALSDFIRDEFERNYAVRPAYLIPPGVNPHHFPLGPFEKDIDIVGAGSLIPLKCYDVFIKSVAAIKKSVPDLKAVLIGDGTEKARLKNLIAELALEETVQLAGELPHEKVLKMMQRTKVFLHPSSYEGFGVVCLEALYAGANVISFVRPMAKNIEHWHIVKSANEMQETAIKILKDQPPMVYKTSLPFSMETTAKLFINLFSRGKV